MAMSFNTLPTVESDILTFPEAIKLLRVSRSTLYRLIWSGQLTGYKVGTHWRFLRSDLQGTMRPMQLKSAS